MLSKCISKHPLALLWQRTKAVDQFVDERASPVSKFTPKNNQYSGYRTLDDRIRAFVGCLSDCAVVVMFAIIKVRKSTP